MNTIQQYNSSNKLNYIFKKAWKLGFSHPNIYGNKSQMLYRVIQQCCFKQNKVELINVQFDFLDIIPCVHTPTFNEKMSKLNCYFYTKYKKKWVCWEQPLVDKIEECLTEKKALFLMVDLINYSYYEKKYCTHATCIIINEGKIHYINPHGESMKEINTFQIYTKRSKRAIKIKFQESLDMIFMKRFIKFLNRKLTTNLLFKNNKSHVYNGPCLQIADNHGICFIFPIIIWFHYENTYQTSKNTLKKGNLTKFICESIKKFHPKLENIINNKKTWENCDDVSNTLEKLNYSFIKNVCNKTISFMSQKYFMNKI